MKRFLSCSPALKTFRFYQIAFFCFLLIGNGKVFSEESISRVRILSAKSAEFVKEPDSHSYMQRGVRKEDLNGHPHIPGSSFFAFLNFLNPARWFDRNITEDAYDILLNDVSVSTEKETFRKIDFVLIRHVTRGRKPEWSWDQGYNGFPNVKKFIVDQTTNESQNFRDPIRTTLWYSNTPVLLSKLSKNRKDDGRWVYIGHIHIDQEENSDTGESLSVPHLNYGRFGVFFGVNSFEEILSYSDPICHFNSHEK
ncbi:hypothetical protein [Leptospira stimsonii]|uniref:Uncharacterized protein n=1 Tax=Leptospira stimsonii TaxID=2202203 RepID=A0A396Z7C8_9LEPT|nr:hypothetical protein [Leptospira stimsonii]RHX90023.1 hypothetical protein DLM75_13915 [Leptospira stimsonii]